MRARVSCLLAASMLSSCAKYHARPLQAKNLEREYHARSLDDPTLHKYVESNIGATQMAWPPQSLDLKTLTLVGYYYSASLDVARAQLSAAEAGIQAARARINPGLVASGGYDRNPESHFDRSIGPMFTLETAGKRGYRILRAEAEAESARNGLAEASWQLRSGVRAAFVNHLLAIARLELLEREAEVRREIVEMFDRRVAVGEAARPELDIYRVDLITVNAALRRARGDVSQTRASLASAVGVPSEVLSAVTWTAPGFESPAQPEAVPINAVERAGVLHRADLRRSLSDFAAADVSLRLELARQYPDVVLSPAYDFEEAFARYVLSATLEPLALFHRNQGPIAVAVAQREEAAAKFEALQARAIGEMETALIRYRAAFEQWQEAGDQLTTVQRDREEAARRALAVGEGDRLAVATARLETVTAARTRLDALAEVQTAMGALEDAMQQPLEDALTVPDVPRVSPRKGAPAQ
jgi:cobalt-zinc-cadmium efflux system outer membrane protein